MGPSSPGAATTARGFRRASEISIASQVSGMAESYTASSIAQSEYSGAGAHPAHTLPFVPAGTSVPLQGQSAMSGHRWGEGTTGIWWVDTRDAAPCPGMPRTPHRGVIWPQMSTEESGGKGR